MHLGEDQKSRQNTPAQLSCHQGVFLEAPTCLDSGLANQAGVGQAGEQRTERYLRGFEQVAAGAPEASGGLQPRQGPPPERLEPGTEAGGRALAAGPTGCGARTCGKGTGWVRREG